MQTMQRGKVYTVYIAVEYTLYTCQKNLSLKESLLPPGDSWIREARKR
jgi:hypothetical protein